MQTQATLVFPPGIGCRAYATDRKTAGRPFDKLPVPLYRLLHISPQVANMKLVMHFSDSRLILPPRDQLCQTFARVSSGFPVIDPWRFVRDSD